MIDVKFKAYGKINLYLNVGEVRGDGFHSVESIMQRAPIYDTVRIKETEESGIKLICHPSELPCGEDNLIYKAVEMLHEAIGKPIGKQKSGYEITVEKRIPIAGGMGGGSADAGYTLRYLNKALGYPLTVDELSEIAAKLGSDVPFFVYGCDTMQAMGRGEKMTKCPPLPPCKMEFYTCGKKQSTGAMFAVLDKIRKENKLSEKGIPTLKQLKNALERGNLREICEFLHNSFQAVFTEMSEEHKKEFSKIKSALTEKGAFAVLLCGSGPTVCGIFPEN